MHLLRKLVTAGLLATLFLANYASAFGLGEISLKSALNQPLNAEIRLLNIRNLSDNDIIINLASPEDFERAGVDRLFFYNELQFQVLTRNPDGPIVRVTSRNPVREPYLNFLIEARWASGRLLREYTLLLDLPTFGDAPAAPVQAPRQAPVQQQPQQAAPAPSRPAAQPRPQQQPQATPEPTRQQPAQQAAPSRGSVSGNAYGPVQANETLWEIALRVRPDSSVSVQQTMLALQRQNPDAFINGNINLLRRGQVLRIPSADEIRNLNQSQAMSQVAAQNREWSERRTGAQLDAGRRETAPRREPTEVSGQVRLATQSQEGAGGRGTGGSDERSEALSGELANARDELERNRRENTELTSRVRELEAQIETMERLISVSNEQLRALQLSAAEGEGQQPVQEPADQASAAETVPAQSTAPAVSEAADEESAAIEGGEAVEETAPADTTPAEATPVVREEPRVESQPAAPRVVERSAPRPKTLMDHIQDNLILIGAGLLVLLLAVWYFVNKRKSDKGFDDDEYEDDEDLPDDLEPLADFDTAQDDELLDPQGDDFDQDFDLADEQLNAFDQGETDDSLSTDAETGDVVGEADIYIAYGKLDQAEEMLLKGLSREPRSAPILLKLLEVYSETQNLDAFDKHYGELLATHDPVAIERAAELRETLPGAGQFDASRVPSEPVPAEETDFNFDLDDTPAQDTKTQEPLADDLDLGDLDFSIEDEPATATSNTLGLEDDDFTFDLDDEEPLEPEAPLVQSESDVATSGSDYDMSFDGSGDEASFDFSLDDELPGSDADGSDDLSLLGDELSLDDDLALENPTSASSEDSPVQPPALSDDVSFDLELDDEPSITATSELTMEEPEVPAFQEKDDFDFALEDSALSAEPLPPVTDDGDEFDLDMDMGDMDMAALDEEMAALDLDLGAKPTEDLDIDFALDEPETPAAQPVSSDPEDDVFEEALSGLTDPDASSAEALANDLSDDEMDAELDFLADSDEAATKLDLARAYIDMGDSDGARDILGEVIDEGNDEQRKEAQELLARVES